MRADPGLIADPGRGTPVPDRAQALSPSWLTRALGAAVQAARPVRIGPGMMSDTFRMVLTGDDVPASVVLKVPAADGASRRAAATYRSYELEARFYAELAPTLEARVPHCHWAGWDPDTGDYAVVLEDVAAGVPGDQLRGCDADQAGAVVDELAALHAGHWDTPHRPPWLRRYGAGDRTGFRAFARSVLPDYLARYATRLGDDVTGLVERFVEAADRYDRKGRSGPPTLVRGDLRADNLIFQGGRAVLLDWQNVFLGSGLIDLAYFLGTSLATADRRAAELDLVGRYHAGLSARGVQLNREDCWTGYRRHAFAGLCMALRSFAAVGPDPGRDRRLLTLAERSGRQALDLDAESLLEN